MQHSYTSEALKLKICTSFLNHAEILISTYGYTLWYSQIVYIRQYSLNTSTEFCFATESWDVSVCLRASACHKTSYFTWYWSGLDSVSYSGCSIVAYQGLRFSQGCSADKKGVGTHPKNSHFKVVSSSFWSKREKGVGTPSHAIPLHYTPGVSEQ